jgi:hypothetical protein
MIRHSLVRQEKFQQESMQTTKYRSMVFIFVSKSLQIVSLLQSDWFHFSGVKKVMTPSDLKTSRNSGLPDQI